MKLNDEHCFSKRPKVDSQYNPMFRRFDLFQVGYDQSSLGDRRKQISIYEKCPKL